MYAFYGAHVVRATGRSTFIADYSLAPEVRCPKQLIELEQAYTALVAQYGPGQVIVMGDSCGGGMALSLLMTVRERGGPQPAGLVSIGGWFDLTASGDSATVPVGRDPFLNVEWLRLRGRDYVGPDADPADPIASPLFGDHAGLAPMLLHTGTVDRCRSDAERLAASVTEAGGKASITIVDGMPQGFHGLVGVIPEADAAWVEIAVAIESWLKR
jgi:acetyl esterase/lipase